MNAENFCDLYDESEKKAFVDYMRTGLSNLNLNEDPTELEKIFLGIYANQIR
jgi:hypothetical protein